MTHYAGYKPIRSVHTRPGFRLFRAVVTVAGVASFLLLAWMGFVVVG